MALNVSSSQAPNLGASRYLVWGVCFHNIDAGIVCTLLTQAHQLLGACSYGGMGGLFAGLGTGNHRGASELHIDWLQ